MSKRNSELGYWSLPLPENPADKYKAEWERIPRLNLLNVPFGYEVDPEDPEWLLPIAKELELFELAKEYLKRYSYADVAAWLTTQSGRNVSVMGLHKRVKIERKRKKLAAIKRHYAERLRKTLSQIEALEHQRLGAKKRASDESGSGSTGEGTAESGTTEDKHCCPCCGATASL